MTEEQNRRFEAEIADLMATTSKLNAETAKLTAESGWYWLVAGSAGTLAIVVVVKLFL